MKSFFEKFTTSALKKLIKDGIEIVFQQTKTQLKTKPKNSSAKKIPANENKKNHPWRLCPLGEHWVRPHGKNLKSGVITDHDGHCRKNDKRKSEFYTAEELRLIAATNFEKLSLDPNIMPIQDKLDYPNGNQYDLLIAGWTKFWNDILKPKDPLHPDFVKALIATESSFKIPKDQSSSDGLARGPIQITEGTRKILQNLKGELKNHYIKLKVEESRDLVTNIAAGIRWLHHKKFLLKHRIKRDATWEEAVAEYKGLTDQLKRNPDNSTAARIMTDLKSYYQKLNCKRQGK